MLLFLILNYVLALSLSWVVHGYISKEFWRRITVLGLIFTFILIIEGIGSSTIYASYYIYNGLLEITTQSLTFTSLIIITGIGLLCLPSYSDPVKDGFKERQIFILSTILGGILLCSCTDVLTFLLGLELQSYSVYVLAASERNLEPSEAAGLKYFLLGALSSALIFMGLILIYVYSGVTSISSSLYTVSHSVDNNSIYLGLILVLIGLFWKVAAAPLHAWSIDVYDAVPGKVTSILSILPKIGLFSLILQLILELKKSNLSIPTSLISGILFAIIGISILSLLIGGTLGLFSPRIKRLLAYSSILNVGFIILGCLLGSSMYSVYLYVIQYIITTMGVWLCLSNLNRATEIVLTSQLQGLGSSHILSRVFVGICLSILLLSTAGIPPMIGFFAKYEIIALAIEKGFILLAMVAVIASLISTVYYLRVVRNIWMVNYTPLVQELSVPYVFVVQKTKIQYSYSFYSITLIVLFVILYFLQSMEIYTYLSL